MDLMDDGSNVSSQRDGRFKVVPLDAVGKVEENRGSAPTALMKNVGVVNPSLTRILLKIMLHRTLILVPLMTLVLVTNSSIWASSTTGSIFLFQTMIAVIGIITALLLYECSWMMQGAVAVLWTWRRRGQRKRRRRDEYLPLIVGESIQTGRPSSLFGKGASLQDVCVVMFVPICVGMVEATYKFGVSIKDNASTRRSTVMTTFLSRGIERIPAIVEGCERTDNVCNWNYLQQRYGLVPSSH
ncbi:hypothetical protein BC829DRAFT_101440 [Chytridium lagenaria]|nr:hypothetical protein BC829DRAFT_101440 [Chytridium lagenaria]